MSAIFLLIPLGIVLLLVAIAAFCWAVGDGQFDDLDAQGQRILLDDDARPPRQPPRVTDAPSASAAGASGDGFLAGSGDRKG